LSYAAVFSIVVGMKNIYHLLYFKQKWLDAVWKFNAVTLSAQLFTLPFVLYHFHQFPNYFLCSNWIAVPLSSIILIAEIILVCVAWIAPVAAFTGHITGWLINKLNEYIQWLNDLPGAITDHIYFPMLYALLLAIIISFGMYAWFHQQKKYIGLALVLSVLFMGMRIMDYYTSCNQQQLIVYAVPKQSAIDIQTGRQYTFWGDTALLHQPTLFNFNCKPARTFYQCFNMAASLPKQSFYSTQLANTQIIFCAEGLQHWPLKPSSQKQIVIVANNSVLPLQEIAQQNSHTSIVWDGSNTLKKVQQWKSECAQLQLSAHYVTTEGAFVTTL
jgi:competence protein ComEC